MKKIRAIYIYDVRFEKCPVFELKEDGWFEMIEDSEFRYEEETVVNDKDWRIFEVDVDEDTVKPINR